MRISNWLKIILAVFVVLFSCMFSCLFLLNASFKNEADSVQRQIAFKQLGIELAAASDYLTNEARAYVQFGERVHADNYWREVNETKTRDKIVTQLAVLGAQANELKLIEQAKQYSDALVKTEAAAMDAATQGDFELARKLMFDKNYARDKQSIMNSIANFQSVMNERAQGEAKSAHSHAANMLKLTIVFSAAAFAILLGIFLLFLKKFKLGKVDIMMNDLIVNLQSVKKYKDHLEELVEQRTGELERKNVQLVEAKEVADAANRSKSQFIANMSHEIRTPINAIIGFNYLLQQSNLSNQQKVYVDKAVISAKVLLTIVNDILDFSKIEVGKMQLEEIDFDLYEVLSNISNIVSFKAYEKGLKLRFSVHHSVSQTLKGDPFRLSQILLNLTNNAIKFTEHGEVSINVSLQAATEAGGLLRFEVHDTGVGISKEHQMQLFREFSQADMSTTRRYGGTGLGLVICKNLAELMGGTIGCESELGVGSTFFFTARLDKSTEILLNVNRSRLDSMFLRVLLVCDNAEMHQVLQNQLEQFRFIVEHVRGEELMKGNRPIEQYNYDLVIVDRHLYTADPHELTDLIRIKQQSMVPILFLVSEYHETRSQEKGPVTGIDKLIYHPVSQSQLYNEIVDLIKLPRAQQETVQEEKTGQSFTSLRNADILLVEDNEINQIVAKTILEEIGARIIVANNGAEAIERFGEMYFDAVIMDLQMPVMDGIEATKAIRERYRDRNTPIIAMTADAMQDTKETVLAAGMDDYITKPFDPIELFSMLKRLLQR
ncbi:response regulator [Paenibacillus albus]|nr:response regulator [Paenibacillus albus]